ncbi:hypothetical protein PUNSTDRAFT_110415 [Punctularia strigosozonata HHB-11173 SS5]|uniref:uncharacterized protein n=1 Tax=Punctularia strigosozonata (strain HHB-11173) TaxID=741275 RepID=UPI0004416358|nr:uncharacterized protein PUNSTDRAFT_110415 [Punctularia strigosozonata HHB-11173 SS5]EIN14304.1 hypothetical protein PUNSTDRAFT_110415 [Punctularia strigosozonata HHB-11173 SS5]
MVGRDSRSPSPSRRRSRSPERRKLPHDAEPLSEADYFLKSSEFKVWLKEEKDRYFDELSGEKARSYFRKFVKAWNRGKLSKSLYLGVEPTAQSATAYKWSIKTSGDDLSKMKTARTEVESANYEVHRSARTSTAASGSRTIGPSMPSREDAVLAREAEEEAQAAGRSFKRKRDRLEAKERIEEMVGPKEVGRAGMLEAKRARRENDRAYRESRDDSIAEVDEVTLGLGGGDSFQERIRQRDAARKRAEERKHGGRAQHQVETKERSEAIRQKEHDTMEMFKRMAAERFG